MNIKLDIKDIEINNLSEYINSIITFSNFTLNIYNEKDKCISLIYLKNNFSFIIHSYLLNTANDSYYLKNNYGDLEKINVLDKLNKNIDEYNISKNKTFIPNILTECVKCLNILSKLGVYNNIL